MMSVTELRKAVESERPVGHPEISPFAVWLGTPAPDVTELAKRRP